jgi:hypothetical protein
VGTDIDHSIVIVGDRDRVDNTTWKIFKTNYQERVGCRNAKPLADWWEDTPEKDARNLIHREEQILRDFTYPGPKDTCIYINKKENGVQNTGPGWPGYLQCGNYQIPCKDDHEYVEMIIDHCPAEGTNNKFTRQSTYVCKSPGVKQT